jgi:hypothetical protein
MEDRAFSRLLKYFTGCFTTDGIHIENSPTYHVMVSRYLKQIVEYARVCGRSEQFGGLAEVLAGADLYAAHALTPNGYFPPISDNAPDVIKSATARSTFGENHFLAAVTHGDEGTLPPTKAFVAEKSGYATHRSSWTEPEATHVFFSAAYNANYHKHSDELSLYISSGRQEILREAGPFGYEKTNPMTAYGFSSRAHNTLLVDGRGLPRADGSQELTHLKDVGSTPTTLAVEGSTRRFEGIEWSRRVTVAEKGAHAPVVVVDRVAADSQHTFTFMWHVAPDLVADARGNALELYTSAGVKVAELTWTGSPSTRVRLVRGQKVPHVQGWYFPRMRDARPATVLEVDVDGAAADVTWELRTRDFLMSDRGVNPVTSAWSVFSGEKPVHYLLELPKDRAPKRLAVVFSALEGPWEFGEAHRTTLKGLDPEAATLYVLDDFGEQGAYYLANGRNPAEFRSVQGLLHSVLRQVGLGPSDAITMGSAKGGTAAIMHGVSLGAARVIAGAPEVRIGNYLKQVSPVTLDYIAGGTGESSIRWANGAMLRALESGVRSTSIEIVLGQRDHHFEGHVKAFVPESQALGYDVSLLLAPGTPHPELGAVFRSYLESSVLSYGGEGEPVMPHVVAFDPIARTFGGTVLAPNGSEVSFRIFREGKPIDQIGYSAKRSATWKIDEPGRYRIRFHVRPSGGGDVVAFGSRTVRVDAGKSL